MLMVSTPGPTALPLLKLTPQASKATKFEANIKLASINIA
jgi:hypothetical protein